MQLATGSPAIHDHLSPYLGADIMFTFEVTVILTKFSFLMHSSFDPGYPAVFRTPDRQAV